VVVAMLAAAACSGEKKRDIGQDTANIVSDTNVMEEAEAAANAVIRNASDCDAVKAVLPETKRRLEEADKRVRTMTGRARLDSLKKQVATVADACP